jgi:hypothetical protein
MYGRPCRIRTEDSPAGILHPKPTVPRDDVGFHEVFEKGDAERTGQLRHGFFEIRTRPLALLVGETRRWRDGGNRTGLQHPQSLGIKQPFQVDCTSKRSLYPFRHPGEFK